jgi:hypothetical protein
MPIGVKGDGSIMATKPECGNGQGLAWNTARLPGIVPNSGTFTL